MKESTVSNLNEPNVSAVREYDKFVEKLYEITAATKNSNEIMPLSGLTQQEDKIMALLVLAFNEYTQLPKQRDHYDLPEFTHSLHNIQQLLAIRHLRREHPQYWISSHPK